MKLLCRVGVVMMVLAGLPVLFAQPAAAPAEKPVVRIGVVIPLTGSGAALGEEMRDALTLAQEDLKDTHFRYELIFEDDGLMPARTAAAAQKLLRVDKVDAIVSLSSGTGNVIAPLAEQAKVVHVALASDPHVAQGKYNFIHWTQPADETAVFIKELKKRQVASIAFCELNQQGCIAVGDELAKQLDAAGIKLTSRNRVNTGDRDFRMMLAKIGQEKPGMICLMLFSPEIELIQKQVNEAKMNIPTTSIEGFDLSDSPSIFEGKWYVSGSAAPEFLQHRLRERFNQKHLFSAGHAYDAFNLLVQAYEKNATPGVKPPPEAIAADLARLEDYHSILGRITISPEKIIHSDASVKMIKNGEPVTLN